MNGQRSISATVSSPIMRFGCRTVTARLRYGQATLNALWMRRSCSGQARLAYAGLSLILIICLMPTIAMTALFASRFSRWTKSNTPLLAEAKNSALSYLSLKALATIHSPIILILPKRRNLPARWPIRIWQLAVPSLFVLRRRVVWRVTSRALNMTLPQILSKRLLAAS